VPCIRSMLGGAYGYGRIQERESSMALTPSQLRSDLRRILDQVLETGVPVEIEWRGKTLKIVPPEDSSKLDALRRRDYLKVDPEELVHIDWSDLDGTVRS